MINIYELEDRWLKYKIRSLLPYAIIASVALIFVVIMIIFNIFTKEEKKDVIPKVKETQEISKKKVPVKEIVKTKDQNISFVKKDIIIDDKTDEKVVLSPSLNFLDNINKHETKRDKIIKHNKQNKNLNPVQKKEVNTYVNKKEKSYNNTTSRNNNHNTIQISKQNTDEDISHVIKRFNKNNNPALSLFIAKKYYDQGKYDKSYNYALITNNISKNMEASWIIFAKSLVKLHKKNKAIDTLKKYISHSDSHKAKILLDEITSGKFNAQ